ncbi:MAG: triose-phosphate isomerase [Alphaproteobacteria bacterium]
MERVVIGNWKMNGLRAAAEELTVLQAALRAAPASCGVMICPPATLLADFAARCAEGPTRIGAQDCHWKDSGAHTGDIAASMLRDAGASAVIVGHSERRADHGETDVLVRAKAEAALAQGLTAIICIGETEGQRDAGETLAVLSDQLTGSVPDGATASTVIVAYEPVWAIGTGRTPTLDQIAEVHAHLHKALGLRFGANGEAMRLVYGGSVKPGNAADIFRVDHVHGGLIGGASLRAVDFEAIIRAVPA